MAPGAPWQTRPIFITSTFRDMQTERDWLRLRVFPALEERLRARRTHLEPIDLRWGVETVSADEEKAKELLVLKVCLAEVERSRPFLIGLVGDRYGWIPPPDRMLAAAAEVGFTGDVAGRSVTDLEIDFGVLASGDQRRRCRFYVREPLPYGDLLAAGAMTPTTAADYSEDHRPDGDDGARRLHALKDRLTGSIPDRVRTYRTGWDADRQAVTGLEAWGEQVLEDLWQDLAAETEDWSRRTAATWQEAERFALEQFLESLGRDFVGREAILDDLTGLARSPVADGAPWSVCVTAPPGAGKSALAAAAVRRLQAEPDLTVLVHAAGISPRATQVDGMLRRWIEELQPLTGDIEPLADDAGAEAVERAFQLRLERVSAERRVVLVIDALDRFEPTQRGRHLSWLPSSWPPGARLIATAIPGSQTEALAARDGVTLQDLPPLDHRETAEIATTICRRYRRSLHPDVLAALVGKRRTDGAAAAGNALWLQLAVEELNLLDADDFARLDREFTGSAEQRLHQLLLAVATDMPPTVADLYGSLLERAEQLHGTDLARAFVNLVAVGRTGWREADFRALLPRLGDAPWDELRFAALRRTFRAHVVQRGAGGQWDVAHAQLRQAVQRRNLDSQETTRELHRALADHLEALPPDDPLRQTETMIHLLHAGDPLRAVRYFGGVETTAELTGATEAVAARHAEAPDATEETLLAFLELPLPADLRDTVNRRFVFELDAALRDRTSVAHRITIARAVVAATQRLADAESDRADRQKSIKFALDNLGDLLMIHGDLDEAMTTYRQAMAALDAAGDTGDPRGPLVTLERLGTVAEQQGDLAAAGRAFSEMGERARELSQANQGDTTHIADISHACIHLASLAIRMGQLDRAENQANAAIGICVQLCGLDHVDTSWIRDHAAALMYLGIVKQTRGELDEAMAAIGSALSLIGGLIRRNPVNIEWRQIEANLLQYEGMILQLQGRLDLALVSYRNGLNATERMAARDAGNTLWRQLVVNFRQLVGLTLQGQGELDSALATFRVGIEQARELVALDPTNGQWRYAVANFLLYRGGVLQAQGDLAAALDSYREGLGQAEELVAQDPGNGQWQQLVATLHQFIGSSHQNRGELDEARQAYRTGRRLAQSLVDHDPFNGQWQQLLANFIFYESMILQTQGDLGAALTSFRTGLQLTRTLARRDPTNGQWQQMLASYLEHVAAVLHGQGQLDEALATYREGLTLTGRLLDQDPTNGQWQQLAADFQFHLGSTLKDKGDWDAALAAYDAGLAGARELLRQDPTNAPCRHLVASIHRDMGALHQNRGDLAGAVAAYQTGLDISRRALQDSPENAVRRQVVADFNLFLGSALQTQGDLDGALACYDQGLALIQPLAEQDPDHAQWQHLLASLHRYRGKLLQGRGDHAQALAALGAGLEVTQKLANQDPTNSSLQRLLADYCHDIAATLQSQDRLDDAERMLRAGLQVMERFPDRTDWRRLQATVHLDLGKLLQKLERLDEALADYDRSVAMAEQLWEQEPDDGNRGHLVVSCRLNRGDAHQARGDLDQALADFETSLAIMEELTTRDPANGTWQQLLAHCHLYLGSATRQQGRIDAAASWYRQGIAVMQPLIAASPNNAAYEALLKSLHHHLGCA